MKQKLIYMLITLVLFWSLFYSFIAKWQDKKIVEPVKKVSIENIQSQNTVVVPKKEYWKNKQKWNYKCDSKTCAS